MWQNFLKKGRDTRDKSHKRYQWSRKKVKLELKLLRLRTQSHSLTVGTSAKGLH